MEKKRVLFSLFAIAFAGAAFLLATSGTSKQSKYTPRNKQEHKSKLGINGAVEYLSSIRNNQETGTLDAKWVIDAREAASLMTSESNKSLGLTWDEVGPDNMGGRTRAILIDKTNPNLMYAGGVSGGLWKSTTGGSSWTQITNFSDNLAISCIAQSANGTIYVGTGEGLGTNGSEGTANGGTAFIGNGMYQSTDGNTFTVIPSTVPTTENSSGVAWAYINKIECDPSNPNRIYAATNRGLRGSDDGGTTWVVSVKLTNGNDNTGEATDVDVASDGTVITSVSNKFYVSPNGDEGTFVCQSVAGTTGDLPAGSVIRLENAIAPSNPNVMYACAAKIDGSLYNIYKSTDKGDNWTIIGPGGSSLFQPLGSQGWYDNTIAVYPNDPDKILVGGLDMWEWHEGGTWTQKSIWYLNSASSYYLHADHHTYVFHPTNPDILFVGSDGGVSRSTDGGETFQTMNINYNTIQCYAISASPAGYIMSGTQDNGTLYLPRIGAFPKHAEDIMGGDGGWSTFSYINPEAYFATVYNAGTRRSPDMGANFYPATFDAAASNHFFSARMMPTGQVPGESTFPAGFVTPLVMWEDFNDTYAYDSIEFTPPQVANEKIEKGVSGVKHYSGILERDNQPYAMIVPGSFQIVSGSLYVTDDGNGNLTGTVNSAGVNTINYTTGAWDVEFSSAPANAGNILGTYNTEFASGSNILVESSNKPGTFWYTTPISIGTGESVMIQDIVQAKFYIGFNNGIWMTKDALDFANRPEWFKVANIVPSGGQNTQCLALSKDGNYLFAGTNNGKLFRLSNLRAAQDSITADYGTSVLPNTNSVVGFTQLNIPSSNRAITSIAVCPDDPNKMIVTLGNYGNNVYVYYTSNALDSVVTFVSKQGNLPKMPVYSSLIPMFNSSTVLLGTEYGVYSTENIAASSVQWESESTGMLNVPVFMLWQQIRNWESVTNYGTIYAATHGRGVFECNRFSSINEQDPETSDNTYMPLSLSIYPNPATDNATVSYTLDENSDIKVSIYDLSGKLITSVDLKNMAKGYHSYKIDCSMFKNGTYFIQMQNGSETATAKFIKML